MAWTNLTFAFGSILTSTQMTNLDANFDALANGDSGAPRIQEAAITGQAAIDRTACKTTTQTIAGSLAASSTLLITFQAYCFFPMFHDSNAGGNDMRLKGHTTDGASADSPRCAYRNSAGKASYTYDVDNRYIQA